MSGTLVFAHWLTVAVVSHSSGGVSRGFLTSFSTSSKPVARCSRPPSLAIHVKERYQKRHLRFRLFASVPVVYPRTVALSRVCSTTFWGRLRVRWSLVFSTGDPWWFGKYR